MSTPFVIYLFLSFILFANVAMAQVTNPTGTVRATQARDILPKTRQGDHFNEFWTYHFYLNKGIKIHITFSLVNLGSFKSPVSGIRLSILNLDGETYHVSREYPLEKLVIDAKQNRLQLHPERDFYFEGNLPGSHRVRIFNQKDGVLYDIDLTFSDIQPGRIWGDGLYSIGQHQIGIITHIPYANVRGHVAVNSARENVEGTAYMDHIWQTQSTLKHVHGITRFVSHTSPSSWDLLLVVRSKQSASSVVGYRLRQQRGAVSLQGARRKTVVQPGREQGWSVPLSHRLLLNSGAEIDFTREINEEVFSSFSELGFIARRLAQTMLGGELVDFRGRGMIRENGMVTRGHYSMTIVD
jgi:hypothetical protein